MTHPYCEDCKFVETSETGIAFARCGHPNAPRTRASDRFVARQFDKPSFASTMRGDKLMCGTAGEWFERRAPERSDVIARIMGDLP